MNLELPRDHMAKAVLGISPHWYSSLVEKAVVGGGYAALPVELLNIESVIRHADMTQVQQLNRFLCRKMLHGFTPSGSPWKLPRSFFALYQAELDRIAQDLVTLPDTYYRFCNDPFRKDLAILGHRLIPCGAEFITPFSGLSRSLAFKVGLHQAFRFLQVVCLSRGVKPFLELHMHPRVTQGFDPPGWLLTYENLADFLELNPRFLGVQSTSWFLDPALAQVSPHLLYLRQIPEQCGAAILYAGRDDPATSGAFATSRSRRALFEQGLYFPERYTRIWPRSSMLQRQWRILRYPN